VELGANCPRLFRGGTNPPPTCTLFRGLSFSGKVLTVTFSNLAPASTRCATRVLSSFCRLVSTRQCRAKAVERVTWFSSVWLDRSHSRGWPWLASSTIFSDQEAHDQNTPLQAVCAPWEAEGGSAAVLQRRCTQLCPALLPAVKGWRVVVQRSGASLVEGRVEGGSGRRRR